MNEIHTPWQESHAGALVVIAPILQKSGERCGTSEGEKRDKHHIHTIRSINASIAITIKNKSKKYKNNFNNQFTFAEDRCEF